MVNFFKILLTCFFITFLSIPSIKAQTAVESFMDGNDDFKQGNLDKAIVEYTKAIDINPNFAKAYNNRGVAYAHEGSLQRAVDDFTMAIADNLNDAGAYNNRGHAYAMLGNFKQAIVDYTKAIKINPLYIKAYNNRAFIYYKAQKYDAAWVDVHKVQSIGGVVDSKFLDALVKSSGNNS